MKRLLVLATSALLVAGSAQAQEKRPPFTINFTQVLLGVGNKPLVRPDPDCIIAGNKKCPLVDMTLGDAAVAALTVSLDEDRNLSPEQKFKNGELAREVYRNKAAVLSPEQIVTIKDRIGKAYGAAVVAASWPLLDPTLRVATPLR